YGRLAEVIYPGVDSAHFKPSHDAALAEKYSRYQVILHSASYFTPVKGTHFLIEALAHVSDIIPNCRLLVLNCKRNDSARERLASLARRLGVLDRVEFLPPIKDEMLPYYYSLAKAVVQPSINESFRLSLQEGAACETPGICFSGGSADEDIADGETGFIVPFGDTRALASSIVKILSDADLRKRMGMKGRKRVLEVFNWDGGARALLGKAKSGGKSVQPHTAGDPQA
ncbi:MAG: glycosyltransferase, partial [Methanotrichaceae archaeon]|nr:glycosyltransferase [Methanotrichaceae archaeon]